MIPVAVTGLGVVTPLGATLAQTMSAGDQGRSAARTPTLLDPAGFAGTRAAEIAGFDPRPWFRTPKALKLTDRQTRLAVVAAAQAAEAAGWTASPDDELGVLIGTSGADLRFEEIAQALAGLPPEGAEDTVAFGHAVLDGLTPLWGLTVLPNMPSAQVAIQLGARGPNSTVMTGWAAGLQAVAEAAEWIGAGEAARVLAGGADTALHPFAFACLHQAGMLSDSANFVPGEGAGVLALESVASARQRGARVAGCVTGTASAAASPDELPATLCRVVAAAMDDAGWTPESVDLFEDAGGGVPGRRDAVRETLQRLFGSRSCAMLRASTAFGHALGAAGPIASALALAAPEETWRRALVVSCDPSGIAAAVAFERAVLESPAP